MKFSEKIFNTSLENDRKTFIQKVVIPKETINPKETVVIEIPSNMKEIPILIAKKQPTYLQKILNEKWNDIYSTYEPNYLIEEGYDVDSTEACMQTSVTEMDFIMQTENPIDLPEEIVPIVSSISSKRYYDDWDYAYAPQRTPADIETSQDLYKEFDFLD